MSREASLLSGGRYQILAASSTHGSGPGRASGAMGTVVRVGDRFSGKVYAAKTFRSRRFAAALLNELVRGMSIPVHPHVVRTCHATAIAGAPVAIMEWAEHGSANTPSSQRSVEACAGIVLDACHGLHHLHSNGVIHGDVKPDNILGISRGGSRLWALSDFGLATVLHREQSAPYGGCLPFLAPECWLASRRSKASDLYAVAVTFCDLLCSTVPTVNRAGRCSRDLHLAAAKTMSEMLTEHLPPSLVRLLCRCVAQQPDERPLDVMELADAIQRYLQVQYTPPTGLEQVAYTTINREAIAHAPGADLREEGARFRTGLALFNAGLHDEALGEFEVAMQIGLSGESVCYVAKCLLNLNRRDQAIELLNQFMAVAAVADNQKTFQSAIRETTLLMRRITGTDFRGTYWETLYEGRRAAATILRRHYGVDTHVIPPEVFSLVNQKELVIGDAGSVPYPDGMGTAGDDIPYLRLLVSIPGLVNRGWFTAFVYDLRQKARDRATFLHAQRQVDDLAKITQQIATQIPNVPRYVMHGFDGDFGLKLTHNGPAPSPLLCHAATEFRLG